MANIGLVNEALVNGVAGGAAFLDPSEVCSATDAFTTSVALARSYTDAGVAVDSAQPHMAYFLSSLASATDVTTQKIAYRFFEVGVGADVATTQLSAVNAYSDHVTAVGVITHLIQQLVNEAADGDDTWFVGTAALLADVVLASGIYTNRASVIQAIAEAVVAAEIAALGKQALLSEGVVADELVTNLLRATKLVLEQIVAADLSTSYLLLINTISEGVSADETVTIWQRLTQSIEEGGSAFVHVTFNGEAYTGWVLNTANTAVSEYQGLNFNSLCKIGNRYFGASDTGIYEITGNDDAGTGIATYVQSGLIDFGSTQQKGVSDAYLAVDADGRIALGVSVSEKSGIAQYWYAVTPTMAAINNIKMPIGRGLRGRYWKFDVASESMTEFDAVEVLPYVLTRRV